MAMEMQFFIARAESNAWQGVDNVYIHAFGRKPRFAARTSFHNTECSAPLWSLLIAASWRVLESLVLANSLLTLLDFRWNLLHYW